MPLHRQHRPNGRLLRGGVDRNSCVMGWAVTRVSRLLRGGVDRNVGATLAAFIVARSPPARRRGSKPDRDCGVTTRQDVASCSEAWIETLSRIATAAVAMVASCAEAWIETRWTGFSPRPRWSPPARRRGSKQPVFGSFLAHISSPPARRRGSSSEEHTYELQSLLSNSYAVFCLQK